MKIYDKIYLTILGGNVYFIVYDHKLSPHEPEVGSPYGTSIVAIF